jgi:hypothetical protein
VRWVQAQRVEALVTSNDLLEHVRDWCARSGLMPGVDIHLINVNAIAGSGVAGIYQDPFGIGATAARLAIEKIIHNEWGVPERRQTVQTTGMWMEGATLRPPPEIVLPAEGRPVASD